jgi:hypothetical protein
MAGIKDAIVDILAKLRTLTVTNGGSTSATPYVRIWNNQLDYDRAGTLESYPKPAFFLEVVSPAVYEIMGEGYRNSDISFRVHLIHEYYNAPDATYEQDLPVLDLRDALIELLTRYAPAGCGPLECMQESQDFQHDNLYHYVLDFVANFTDDKGRKKYILSVPPTDLEIDLVTKNETQQNIYTNKVQLKAYSTAFTATADNTRSFLVLDADGNLIIGANIVSVTIEVKPLTGPNKWSWNAATSNLTLLNGEQVDAGQTAFIIFQQQLSTAN